MADLSRIPTADLEALQQGDISKVSTDTLLFIQKQGDPISGVADQQQAPQAPGLGDKLGQRWKNIGQAFTGQIPGAGPQEPQKPTVGNVALRTAEVPLRVGGQMTGAVGDVLGAAAEAVIPDKAKETIKEGARYVLDSPLGRVGISAAKKGKEYYDLFKKSYPNVAADLEALTNVATIVPMGKAAQMTGKPLAAAGKESLNIAKDVAALAKPTIWPTIEKGWAAEVDAAINKGIEKTVMTARAKKSDPQVMKYMANAKTAVKDIISNKENLKYTFESGEEVVGKLPKSLGEFREAVAQRKKALWADVEKINKTAGESEIRIGLTDLADKLDAFAGKGAVATVNPEASAYAKEMATLYRNKKYFTPQEAQEALTELNKRFEVYIKNPTVKKEIDVIAGNNIRNAIDESIASLPGGDKYKELKRTYGALTAIEGDVTRKSIQDMSKMKGRIGWLDILGGAEFVSGVLTMNPTLAARGALLEGLNQVRKWQVNPNRYVRNMFENADRILERQKGFKAKSKTGQFIQEAISP